MCREGSTRGEKHWPISMLSLTFSLFFVHISLLFFPLYFDFSPSVTAICNSKQISVLRLILDCVACSSPNPFPLLLFLFGVCVRICVCAHVSVCTEKSSVINRDGEIPVRFRNSWAAEICVLLCMCVCVRIRSLEWGCVCIHVWPCTVPPCALHPCMLRVVVWLAPHASQCWGISSPGSD